MDRRESILRECDLKSDGLIWNGEGDIIRYDGEIQTIWNAMDEYMKEACLDLLEYMAKNHVCCGYTGDGSYFNFKGKPLTKEQLFENFL